MQRAGVWTIVVFLALAPALAADSGSAEPAPRGLSEAERAGVELAAAYLQRGPQAWWERLAAAAPLRRLGQEVALDEIAVRAGPADGATWQLLTPARDRSRAGGLRPGLSFGARRDADSPIW